VSCLGGFRCPHRRCCNPAHLRRASRSSNMRAGMRSTRQNCCKRGHRWTDESTYTNGRGHRTCRECKREMRAKGLWA
jgi:hypothetical protein